MTKKILNSNITGQLGINLIEKIVLEMGFIWYPTGGLEAGIDGTIEIRNPESGEVSNNILQVQSKATEKAFIGETDEKFDYTCDERDLEYWLGGNTPVLLIVSRPKENLICWISVQDYFNTPEKIKSRKVIFSKSESRFSKESAPELAKLAASTSFGLYLPPIQKTETIFSNLLEIKKLPDYIYVADTSLRKPKEVYDEIRRLGIEPSNEWILRNKRFLSFNDLDEFPWNRLCDTGTLENFGVDEWAFSDDVDRENEFRDLMNNTLSEMLKSKFIRYSRDNKLYYYTATKKLGPRVIKYQSVSKEVPRTVFKGYSKKKTSDEPAYYRHSAFSAKFLQFDNKWYLEITPSYFFTRDGYSEDKFAEERMKKIKILEQNPAIMGQVVMWSRILQPSPVANLFEQTTTNHIEFGELFKFEFPVGIDDTSWLPKEDDEDKPSVECEQLVLGDL